MKPSDFKLNTDYLSLATIAKSQLVFQFPTMIILGRQTYSTSIDLDVPDGTNAIPNYMVSRDNYTFSNEEYTTFSPGTNLTAKFVLSRVGPTVLRGKLTVRNSRNSGVVLDTITLYVREVLLTAPDAI